MRAHSWMAGLAALSAVAVASRPAVAEEDLFDRAPWSGSALLGAILFEGDEEVENGVSLGLRLGYTFTPMWEVELGLDFAPSLAARQFEDTRYHLTEDTWAARLGADLLFHLRNQADQRIDPYLSIGGGLVFYGADMGLKDGTVDPVIMGGGGVQYHFDDEWAIRLDAKAAIAGKDTEFNWIVGAGVNYRFGAGAPFVPTVVGGDIDSDGDGLLDKDEPRYGTDPFDPDTDKDGLTDGQEVKEFKTNPLDPDCDLDGLKDGAEVLTYKTNPLDPDTDKGGVADGHEVIEDSTDPLNPADDLQLFRLEIEFDYDKANLRSIYHEQLDKIMKVLQRDPGATARVEGHADKRKTSKRDYNLKLSERRAKAVLDYIARAGGVEGSRMAHKGYGFDRPIAPNDTEENMQKNRRTDIYIRPGAGIAAPAAVADPSKVSAGPQVPADLPKPGETRPVGSDRPR